jgi:tight adherence protein B
VVALAQSTNDQALLKPMSDAGDGSVINADDPTALSAVFASEAQALAKQILITVTAPDSLRGTEGTLSISLTAGDEVYTDSAFVTVGKSAHNTKPDIAGPTKLQPADSVPFKISTNLMLGGLAAAALGFLVLVLAATGVFSGSRRATVEDRISAYTRKGSRKLAKAAQPTPQGMTAQAVGMAEKALESNRGLESALGVRLEAAGLSLKPAEWLLAHVAIAVGLSLVGLLAGSGSILYALAGLFVGAAVPWLFLGFKKSRRTKAFKAQLADTLQLMAGSLSAGLSLAQSVDTVVREGQDPMAAEFRRAIVETRLGVQVEDALDGVSERMQSVDFHWVVMAIRIQRDVGGNLAELLNTVAGTIREREYLARQVLALSAEGRLSVWILGGLPPGFMGYLMLANREYLEPLISTTIGYVLLGVMAVLLTGGILWMKKLVKVDV